MCSWDVQIKETDSKCFCVLPYVLHVCKIVHQYLKIDFQGGPLKIAGEGMGMVSQNLQPGSPQASLNGTNLIKHD